MNAAETFAPDMLADICATARDHHARAGRGVLFVQPMADGREGLDTQYFQSCQLLKLASLNRTAGYDLLAAAGEQAGAYQPERQCVLLWLDEHATVHCETIDDPQAGPDT